MANQRNTVHDDIHEAHGEATEKELVACTRERSDGSSDFKGGELVEVHRQNMEEGSPYTRPDSDTQGSDEPQRRRGRKRAHPEETQDDVKERRKQTNRKYYQKRVKSEKIIDQPEDDTYQVSVKQWKCTLLSRNNGLTPRPLSMTTDDYLLVHEKAQQLIESMGYEDEAKKTNALKLIMNESIRTHIEEVQQRLANHPRQSATTARASVPKATQKASDRKWLSESQPDVFVPLLMALLSVLANGRTSETIMATVRTHINSFTNKLTAIRERKRQHPDTIATQTTR